MIAKKLCFVVCQNFSAEVKQVIQNIGDPDVKVISLPDNCTGQLINPDLFAKIVQHSEPKYDKIVFLGSSCLKGILNTGTKHKKLEFVEFQQCFDLLLNSQIINHFIGQGYYLVTNGWFRNYRKNIDRWGFSSDTAKQFFRESSQKIMFLDTGVNEIGTELLDELSEYTGLPYEVLPVGLDYCRLIVEREILNWKQTVEKQAKKETMAITNQQTADFSMAFILIKDLVSLTDETEIANKIEELLNQLFAPKKIAYISISTGTPEADTNESVTVGSKLNHSSDKYLDESANGFTIKLTSRDEILGLVQVEDVAFPQFIPQYKRLLHIIGMVCGLAIDNSRKFRLIHENEHQLAEDAVLLKQANDLKDRFLSIIAHDLKSQFNTIIGFSDILVDDYNELDLAQIREYSEIINSSATVSYRLLENLLEWARLQKDVMPFDPEKLDLRIVVDDVIELHSETASKKEIGLTNLIPFDTIVFADINMLRTVLRNLISNALKFTQPSGMVQIGMLQNDGKTKIFVRDSGLGIKSEDLPKIFQEDSNFTSEGTWHEKGTGLGLVLCKEFVVKHGGQIYVESELGNGSTFFIELPDATS